MSVTLHHLERIFDEIIPVLNDNGANHRFTYAKARRQNDWFFIKIATGEQYTQNLVNENLWCEFMDRVDVLSPGMKLKGPHIVQKIGHDALVFEFIDAPMVATPGDASAWRTHLKRYAETLVKLDTLSGDYSLSHIYTKLNHPYEFDTYSWRKWVEGNVDPLLVKQAKKLFKKYESNVTLRLQHNDMSPWQIFEQGDTWIIFDGEKANLQSPRFNDAAQSYVRMHNSAHDAALAKDFLNTFIVGIGMEYTEFYPQFIPVLTMRAIESLADSIIDSQHYNYATEANALVSACLSGDPGVLIK